MANDDDDEWECARVRRLQRAFRLFELVGRDRVVFATNKN